MPRDQRGYFEAIIDDGRPLISFTGICLGLAGGFVVFQAATGHFLPHDTAYLQMTSEDLCKVNQCRVVHFMIHDRVSFGGSLVAIAVFYLWLAAFPLREGARWAWWTLATSGTAGFGSFLTYLGYGYLDTWHGAATLVLLPCFVGGLWMTRRISPSRSSSEAAESAEPETLRSFIQHVRPDFRSRFGIGKACIIACAAGLAGAGLTIQVVGMTSVFVPTDLTFMGLDRVQINAINPRLIPLIAHDRAGFGGAVATIGLLIFCTIICATPSRALWQVLFLAGIAGWATAIGVHPAIGYTSPIHLAPAIIGFMLYCIGLFLIRPKCFPPHRDNVES